MSNLLIRQQPSIGDCLLLAPLIAQIGRVTVLTDDSYGSGALLKAFVGIPGVDAVVTEADPKDFDAVYDCNRAFIDYEDAHKGDPPLGIAEFWCQHFGFKSDSYLPRYIVPPDAQAAADNWLAEQNPYNKYAVGIVLRSGAARRDWNYDGKAYQTAAWLRGSGFLPITLDAIQAVTGCCACRGKQLDFVAGLIKRMRLVVTPDTGLLHLAQAVGTPQMALWGIIRPELRISGYDCTLVPPESLGNCPGHYATQQWSCMLKITMPMIVKGLRKALDV